MSKNISEEKTRSWQMPTSCLETQINNKGESTAAKNKIFEYITKGIQGLDGVHLEVNTATFNFVFDKFKTNIA